MSGVVFALLSLVAVAAVSVAVMYLWISPIFVGSDLERLSDASNKRDRALALLEIPVGWFVVVQIIVGAIAAAMAIGILSWFDLTPISFVFAAVLIAGGWLLPDQLLFWRAEAERRNMSSVVGIYESLAAVAVAGGSELEFALRNSARLGEGRSWRRLRATLHAGLYSSSNLSDQLNNLGSAYDSAELTNLANLVSVAGKGGLSQVSLERLSTAAAQKQRRLRVARLEGNSAKMVVPISLIFLAFAGYIFLLIQQVLTGLEF